MRSLERGEGVDRETDGQGTERGTQKQASASPEIRPQKKAAGRNLAFGLGSPEPPGTCISVACMAWSKICHHQWPHMHGHSMQGSC